MKGFKKNRKAVVIVLLVLTVITAVSAIYLGIRISQQDDLQPDDTDAMAYSTGNITNVCGEALNQSNYTFAACPQQGKSGNCTSSACIGPEVRIHICEGQDQGTTECRISTELTIRDDNAQFSEYFNAANRCKTVQMDVYSIPGDYSEASLSDFVVWTGDQQNCASACVQAPVNVEYSVVGNNGEVDPTWNAQYGVWDTGANVSAFIAANNLTTVRLDANCFAEGGAALLNDPNFSLVGSAGINVANGVDSDRDGQIRDAVVTFDASTSGSVTGRCYWNPASGQTDNSCDNTDLITIMAEPSITPTPTNVPSPTPTSTPTPTPSSTPSPTPTLEPSITVTVTPTPSVTPTLAPNQVVVDKSSIETCSADATSTDVVYTVVITNPESTDRTVTVIDTFSQDIADFIDLDSISPASGEFVGGVLTWMDLTLPADGTLTLSYSLTVPDENFGEYMNTVEVEENGEPIGEDTETVVLDCLPPTALISDTVDRLLIGVFLILVGAAFYKLGLHEQVGEKFWNLIGANNTSSEKQAKHEQEVLDNLEKQELD